MDLPITVTQTELTDILLNIAPERPVFIRGAPGIGKSALVEQVDAVGRMRQFSGINKNSLYKL